MRVHHHQLRVHKLTDECLSCCADGNGRGDLFVNASAGVTDHVMSSYFGFPAPDPTRILCPADGLCSLTCTQADSAVGACSSVNVLSDANATNGSVIVIETSGNRSFANSSVYCPPAAGSHNCFVTTRGSGSMNGMQLFAQGSFADVSIACDSNNTSTHDCYDAATPPVMHCAAASCEMALLSGFDHFDCADPQSACHPTLQPTTNPSPLRMCSNCHDVS